MIEIGDTEFAALKDYLQSRCGIDVPPDKRYLFVTRLSNLLEELGCPSFARLLDQLTEADDPELQSRLIEAMTTKETGFFRDGHPFDTLRRVILPEVGTRRLREAQSLPPRLRILSAGCSTGEEPYSIAMCVHEWLLTQEVMTAADVTILGVDIAGSALQAARRGVYPASRVRGRLPPGFQSRYLEMLPSGELRVQPVLRALVSFAPLNLSRPFGSLGHFDIIFCRNVVIYFAPELRRSILMQIHDMLNPGGVLILGASEGLYQLTGTLCTIHRGPTTYHRKDG